MSKIKVGFLIGIFALVVAFLGPTLIESPNANANETVRLVQGEEQNLEETLTINATRINSTSDETDVLLTNTDTFNTTVVELNATTKRNDTVLDGDNITVYGDTGILDNRTTILKVEYSPLFGTSDGPRQFIENLPLIFALISAAMIIILVWLGIRQ